MTCCGAYKKFIIFLILLFFPLIQNKSHYQENKKLNEKKKPKTKQNTMYKICMRKIVFISVNFINTQITPDCIPNKHHP